MESMEILKIAIVIILGYFILKFLWNMVGNIIKLIIITILVVIGVHFVRPDLLGEHNAKVEKIISDAEKEIKSGIDKVGNVAVDSTKKMLEDVTN